jgi:hypothetical protein
MNKLISPEWQGEMKKADTYKNLHAFPDFKNTSHLLAELD